MSIHADIVIVGAGLVGSALACALAEEDKTLSVLVLDSTAEVRTFEPDTFDPRVVALSVHSIALLKSMGVWDAVEAQRVSPYQSMSVWDGDGNGAIEFHSADIHLDSLGAIVENSVVLRSLRSKIERMDNVQFLAPAVVESMTLGEGLSVLTLKSAQEVTCDFVIGADGASSAIRRLSGIKTREWEYGQSALVTTVRTELHHQHTAWQRFSHHGPLAFLPLIKGAGVEAEEGRYCSIVWSQEKGVAEELMSLDDDAFCGRLTQAFESKLGAVEWVDQRYSIPLRQCNALSYGVPGLALVGDAAHTVHPLAGRGVNLGLADAQSLVEELVRARARSVSFRHPSIIKRYQRNRRPMNLATMVAMEGFKRLFGNPSLLLQSLRNRGLDWVDDKESLKRLIMHGMVE